MGRGERRAPENSNLNLVGCRMSISRQTFIQIFINPQPVCGLSIVGRFADLRNDDDDDVGSPRSSAAVDCYLFARTFLPIARTPSPRNLGRIVISRSLRYLSLQLSPTLARYHRSVLDHGPWVRYLSLLCATLVQPYCSSLSVEQGVMFDSYLFRVSHRISSFAAVLA